ncbi:MAG: peptide chain release factor 1, partial [Thermoprotei archaeon]
EKDVYGFIALDRSQAAFALLRGRSLEIVEEITSGVPGKHRAGGQSARRFERVIEQLAHEFYKRIGEYAARIFLELPELKGIIIGGPGFTKNEFVEGDYLHYELKKKVLAVVDIGYSGEEGIYELVRRSSKLLENVQYFREKELVQEFLEQTARDTGLAIYGYKEVLKALRLGAVRVLLISEKFDAQLVRLKCPRCNRIAEKIKSPLAEKVEDTCPECGGSMSVVEEKSLVDELIELAEQTGAQVEIISSNTEEGESLRKAFGGVVALLRFRIRT